MTQEELDALLSSDVEDIAGNDATPEVAESAEKVGDAESAESGFIENSKIVSGPVKAEEFKIDQEISWPPPPPTTEHKVVHELDDVTRDSEIKATELFDKLENINNLSADIEDMLKQIESFVSSQEDLLNKLHAKFPDFRTFNDRLEEAKKTKESTKKISNALQNVSNASLEAMESMQYQDIHRQKIERVINVMRALSRYMSALFEGKIEDNKRVGSAVYIHGDSAEAAMDTDDIEALIEKFSK